MKEQELPGPQRLRPMTTEEASACPTCGGQGWYLAADLTENGEPGEPFRVECWNVNFHGGCSFCAESEAAPSTEPALDAEYDSVAWHHREQAHYLAAPSMRVEWLRDAFVNIVTRDGLPTGGGPGATAFIDEVAAEYARLAESQP